jgi:hypothetical protein
MAPGGSDAAAPTVAEALGVAAGAAEVLGVAGELDPLQPAATSVKAAAASATGTDTDGLTRKDGPLGAALLLRMAWRLEPDMFGRKTPYSAHRVVMA